MGKTPEHDILYNGDEAHIKNTVEELLERLGRGQDAEDILWKAVIAYQDYPLYTSSGLPFSYTVKRKKNGEYSGELLISRKEGSKTLTRSSVMLAFHLVQDAITAEDTHAEEENAYKMFNPPEYKGPKAIGQIFGISYIYSLFWRLGLIAVPEKIEARLKGNRSDQEI